MITLIHGENLVSSRNALNQILDIKRKEKVEIIKLDGENISLTDLKQALESHSLFGSDKLIVIENIFSKIKSKARDEIICYLKKENHDNEIIIWEKNTVHHATVKSLAKNTKVLFHKVSPMIFKFLDGLKPGNTRNILTGLHILKKTEAVEMVFYMLCRRISDLLVAADSGNQSLSGMQDWQKARLYGQAKLFKLSSLLDVQEKLFKLDNEIKTGRNILPLSSQLDLLLLEI